MNISKNKLKLLVNYTALFLWGVFCILPVFLLVIFSFKDTTQFIRIPDLMSFQGFTLSNFFYAYYAGEYTHHLQNSLFISFSAVAIVLLVSIPLSYGLAKLRKKYKNRALFLLLSMRFLPWIVLALPLFLFYIQLGIAGTRIGLLAAHLAFQIPFITWLLISFFENIPKEIEEAAIIDGSNSFQVFYKIAVPIISPAILSAAILSFIASWNEYLFGLFLSGHDAQPLTVGITRFTGGIEAAPQYGAIAAYGVLVVFPVLIFIFFVSKYIISGMTAGSVKG